jgi:hypothetical protein
MTIIKKIFGIDPAKRADVPTGLRGSGVTGGGGIFDDYFNQIIFETQADHVINTETKVKQSTPVEGTCYYNSTATEFQDKNDATVTFTDGDKILWAGLDTIAADIDISAIDDLTHIMLQGVTIALGSQDLSLGENQRGELNISGSGVLSVLSSDGLRVRNSGVTFSGTTGDIIINNKQETENINIDWPNLSIENNTTNPTYQIDIDIKSQGIALTVDITSSGANGLHTGSEQSTTWYKIWLIKNDLNTTYAGLLADMPMGLTDGVTANKLIDSTATFITDGVQIGDIAINRTTYAETTITAIDSETQLSVADDVFPVTQNYSINTLSPTMPTGYTAKEEIGSVYNDGSGDFRSFKQRERRLVFDRIDVLSAGTPSGTVDISATVPVTALHVRGWSQSLGTGPTAAVNVYSDPTTFGQSSNDANIANVIGGIMRLTNEISVDITLRQSIYYSTPDATNIGLSGYTI